LSPTHTVQLRFSFSLSWYKTETHLAQNKNPPPDVASGGGFG
jgi:hypothetical protein